MSLVITHRSLGSEAFLVERDCDLPLLLYDRFLKKLTEVDIPARFLGRANWIEFDGDPEPVLREVQELLR